MNDVLEYDLEGGINLPRAMYESDLREFCQYIPWMRKT